MLIDFGDILKLVVNFNMPSVTVAQNVFHYRWDAAGTNDLTDFENTFESFFQSMYVATANVVHANVSLSGIDVSVLKPGGSGTFNPLTELFPVVIFTEGSEMLPHVVSFFLSARTGKARTQGRKYLPGLGEAEQDQSDLSAQALTALALFGFFYTSDILSLATFSLLAKPGTFNQGVEDFNELLGTVVLAATTRTQRRRRPGVGV